MDASLKLEDGSFQKKGREGGEGKGKGEGEPSWVPDSLTFIGSTPEYIKKLKVHPHPTLNRIILL